jgi:hypothetical protein
VEQDSDNHTSFVFVSPVCLSQRTRWCRWLRVSIPGFAVRTGHDRRFVAISAYRPEERRTQRANAVYRILLRREIWWISRPRNPVSHDYLDQVVTVSSDAIRCRRFRI